MYVYIYVYVIYSLFHIDCVDLVSRCSAFSLVLFVDSRRWESTWLRFGIFLRVNGRYGCNRYSIFHDVISNEDCRIGSSNKDLSAVPSQINIDYDNANVDEVDSIDEYFY